MGNKPKPKCLTPSSSLLCKLGSVVVHIDEGMSSKGHNFDLYSIEAGLSDPEVKEWLSEMDRLALIPKKR